MLSGKDMLRFLALLVGLSVVFGAMGASPKTPNRYKWRDAQGTLHYDDTLPDEAVQRGYDVINGQGFSIKHVDRPLSADEEKAEKAKDAQIAAKEKATHEQENRDSRLLAAYPTEAELVREQQEQLATIDQTIQATELSLSSQERSLADMLSHAGDYDRLGKPIPEALRKMVDASRKTVDTQRGYIAQKTAEKQKLVEQFQSDLEHYRAISAANAKN